MALDLLPTNPTTRATILGRPFWQVRYRDGRVISEWELDWSLLPRRGLVALRLICPDKMVAVLGNDQDASDRLFQFKIAFADVELGGSPGGRTVAAQVIGIIQGTDGQCTCYAWESEPGRLVGPFTDNFNDFRYGTVGPLAPLYLGVKPD